jgi:hypothetical protein
MDNIQFNKNGWQNRNKIKCQNGWMYLTIPIYNKYQQNLDEVKIDNTQNWRQKHWNSLLHNYAKAKYFSDYKEALENIYKEEWLTLNDINYQMLYFYLEVLGINTKIVKASDLKVEGKDSIRLSNICKRLQADIYLSGAYALDVYLDKKAFEDSGIKLILQDWHCPEYEQLFPQFGFIPDLSILDLLFNHGPKSLEILMSHSLNRC